MNYYCENISQYRKQGSIEMRCSGIENKQNYKTQRVF